MRRGDTGGPYLRDLVLRPEFLCGLTGLAASVLAIIIVLAAS